MALSIVIASISAAETDLVVTAEDTTGFANGPAVMDLDLAAITHPGSVQLQFLYDDAKLTPVSVEAGAIVTAASKQLAWVVPESGRLSILVSGSGGTGIYTALADGTLATVTFSVYAGATVGEIMPVTGDVITASTPTEPPAFITSDIVDGSVEVVACSAPSAPTNVSATDGTFSDRVRVTWSSVATASQYAVYRGSSSSSQGATYLGSVQWATVFDDYTAGAATITASTGGCGSSTSSQYTYQTYYYFVVALNACGTSGFSAGNSGYRGQAKAASLEKAVAGVLPAVSTGEGIGVDTALALPLQADEPIDASTVWGVVQGDGFEAWDVEWLEAEGAGSAAGWAIYRPAVEWLPGEILVMTAGATTVSGASVGPVMQAFVVDGTAEKAAALWQPDYGAFDTAGLDLRAEGNAEVAVAEMSGVGAPPPAAEALGTMYRIEPGAPFAVPQRVWLPVPEGVDAGSVKVYYLLGGVEDGAWYAGENIVGWMVDGIYLQYEVGGATYLGFVVRHGGVVQLGTADGAVAVVQAAAAAGRAGDVLLVAGLVAVFGLAQRRRMKARAA
ncbi:MAG: hypothetical protein JXR94_07730 [Candidatus Hydrogenedentes bacterium]|nr:hypothetical protein [Candidatus Hydrogenedentota bacterium]